MKLSDEQNGTHEYEDYLKECEGEKQVPEEELEFHYSKDPKKMTMQESLDEMGNSYAGTGCRQRRDGQSWRHRKQLRAPQSKPPGIYPAPWSQRVRQTSHRALYWMRYWITRRVLIVCWMVYPGTRQRG